MFWADKIAEEIEKKFGKQAPVLIRDEKTVSGRVHVGSMRGVAIHGAVHEALTDRGVTNTLNTSSTTLMYSTAFRSICRVKSLKSIWV